MTIFAGEAWDGPYSTTQDLKREAGIYRIVCRGATPPHIHEIEQADDVSAEFSGLSPRGERGCEGDVEVWVVWIPRATQVERVAKLKKIREDPEVLSVLRKGQEA